ncbi:hypothetical protein Tco_0104725 [Tanacetum coccineum]
MSTDKESSAAGTDNRPPMLVESDYESWKFHIERYIHGKTLGKVKLDNQSQNGPNSASPNTGGQKVKSEDASTSVTERQAR